MPEGFRADILDLFGTVPRLLTPQMSAEFREHKKKKRYDLLIAYEK